MDSSFNSNLNFIDSVTRLRQNEKNKQLLNAASAFDNIDKVEIWLQAGAAIESTDHKGYTALILAARWGHSAVVAHLLLKHANIEAVNQYGKTALISSARWGQTAVVKHLLSKGANIEAANQYGETALMFSAMSGHTAVVEHLLFNNANIEASNQEGETALLLAAWKGHTAVVEKLLSKGANIEAADQNGYTALICAAIAGHTAVIRALLLKGANKEFASQLGNTSLMLAAERGQTAVVEQLIDAGAAIEVTNQYGKTPLMLAAERGQTAVVAYLLLKNESKEVTNRHRDTALMLAASANRQDTAFLILRAMSSESRAALKFGQGGCALNRCLSQHPSGKLAVRYEAMASGFERQVGEIYQFFSHSSRSMIHPILAIMLEYIRPAWLLNVNMLSEVSLVSRTAQSQERLVESEALFAQAAVPVLFTPDIRRACTLTLTLAAPAEKEVPSSKKTK